MSEGGGVSASYVDSAISDLRREMLSEIRRLEEQMTDLARAMISAIEAQTDVLSRDIERQTMAVVAGVAANTLMLERTKQQIEKDFESTREKLQLQTEADIQMEIGKKLADAASAKAKLASFKRDIEVRFAKSLEGMYQNRLLYNQHFDSIFAEYEAKLKAIGDHIFRIKDEDLAPATRAAAMSPEVVHGLPIEVDMYRLRVRAESLDGTLSLLRSNRLDEILESNSRLAHSLDVTYRVSVPAENVDVAVQCAFVTSKLGTDVFCGHPADPAGEKAVALRDPMPDLRKFSSPATRERLASAVAAAPSSARPAGPDEVRRLAAAAERLQRRGLISQEALVMVEDLLAQGRLQIARTL